MSNLGVILSMVNLFMHGTCKKPGGCHMCVDSTPVWRASLQVWDTRAYTGPLLHEPLRHHIQSCHFIFNYPQLN